jgi:mannitol/fructose-specific phosphotransferase system IIA component (Ntr-type)
MLNTPMLNTPSGALSAPTIELTPLIALESVHAQLGASRARGALLELTGLIVKAAPEVDPNALVEAFERRELLQSTAVFDGVAFPHCALPGLSRPVLALARSEAGVPFSALNGLDTHIFVAVVTPEGDGRLPLQLLARLSRLFQSQKKLKQRLLETSEPERLLELLREAEAAL